ncbi:nitrogen regulatory protein P-II 1 [Oxobacter pfennigii]|uniref:Nitrogen regulatory protein P-II 1 n=1 Tax=Oxobacter pfennigii TaxID=36849 RepID=A0A0P8X4I2_9CLOT|nr:P-II family nitrogen regulator [Oxobacter pfennigii]KPU45691.1 nitrogen regulatory protein P-II 1 [Oxobacter pfennigii]
MKEVMAIIRMNMINKTKEALMKQGFSSFNCRKVMGRGKRKVDFSILEDVIVLDEFKSSKLAAELSEMHRLIPKRMVSIIVKDDEVSKVVNTLIEVNRTGSPGDGKIFVTDVVEAVRVRTGEKNELAL